MALMPAYRKLYQEEKKKRNNPQPQQSVNIMKGAGPKGPSPLGQGANKPKMSTDMNVGTFGCPLFLSFVGFESWNYG